jgi:hypothetical protein
MSRAVSLFFIDKMEEKIMFEEDIYENMSVKEMLEDISKKGTDTWYAHERSGEWSGFEKISDGSYKAIEWHD